MPDTGEMSCLLCGVSAPAEVLSEALRDDRSGRHKVRRCSVCGHIQLFPLPDEEADKAYYDADRQARSLIPDFDFELWRQKCRGYRAPPAVARAGAAGAGEGAGYRLRLRIFRGCRGRRRL